MARMVRNGNKVTWMLDAPADAPVWEKLAELREIFSYYTQQAPGDGDIGDVRDPNVGDRFILALLTHQSLYLEGEAKRREADMKKLRKDMDDLKKELAELK